MNYYAVLKGTQSPSKRPKSPMIAYFPAVQTTPPVNGSLDDKLTAEQQAAVFAKAQEGTVAGVPVNGASF